MNQIQKLEKEILKHKILYYQGKAIISDEEYDQLEDQLKGLDPDNAVLSIVGSPHFIGEKVQHDKKMLSLNKTYKKEELISWKADYDIVSTFKIDGSSCSILYENGKLKLGKTRGDGQFGENITSKIVYIEHIPKKIKIEESIEVRGEIFCREKDFVHLSAEMEKRGLEKPSSMRNIVAGILGRKENLDLASYLSFQAFDLISEKNLFETEVNKYKLLIELGFETPEFYINKNEKDIESRLDETKSFQSEGEYLIDGLVFTYNDIKIHDELGETSHHPRYKMAFKFQGEVKETIVNSLHWGVSRNGILTPVAQVEPVELSGAVVSNVTLHNFGIAKQYELKKGDKIKIVRSGEVIPKFLEVVESSGNTFKYPVNCPSCNSKTVIDDIRLLCVNDKCPDKIKDSILNFIKKMNIEDLSFKRLEELIALGIVVDIPSLYKIDHDDLYKMDKVKEKLANKIIDNIENSKNVELAVFLSSLGVSGAAINKCEKIVENGFDTVDKVLKLTVESLKNIEGFAEKSSEEFVTSLASKKEMIEELLELGIVIKSISKASSNLSGKKFCFTGTLSRKRGDLQKMVKDNGGVNVNSVSKNTDYLVTNDTQSTSSKFKKATDLNIPIINEDQFLAMLGE
jgi:DNA ligase (NAD+)